MVNMNAADDKENTNKQNSNKLNGGKEEATATVPTMCSESSEKKTFQVKQNGNIVQNNDVHPITNGAYPKAKQVSYCFPNALENSGPSCSRKISYEKSPYGKSGSSQSDLCCCEIDNVLPIKNIECHADNDSSIQKHGNPKETVVCDYDRNSSSEDEECCIYTYKGDSNQMADLPSSFFNLDLVLPRPMANSRTSSPDMDYLEMDFDPGPSNDRYSSTDSECGEKLENEEHFLSDLQTMPKPSENCESLPVPCRQSEASQSTPASPLSTPSPVSNARPRSNSDVQYFPTDAVTSPPLSPQRVQDIDSREGQVQQPVVYCYCVANKLSSSSIDENFNEGDGEAMIWKEHEAKEKQVNQIGVSLCGATAVVNALLGLNIQFSVCAVKQFVSTRFRNETAAVPEYLLSRCYAGATHEDLIRALHGTSQNLVYARFFHMYPRRNISLSSWLCHWIRLGAVPILTLNLQRDVSPDKEIPDCWHHQMVYGVSSRGIHLTNPLEIQRESHLWPQLASPSVLMVRREDVLSRWTPDTDLRPLTDPSRPEWRKMNVIGKVVNLIRENYELNPRSQCTSHVSIPASYSSGVTLCVLRSSPAYEELRLAPELPVDPVISS